jgi:hypothetical protein
MTALSVPAISVSAVARGIADADSVGATANAQAAKPISSKRFMLIFSLVAAIAAERMARTGMALQRLARKIGRLLSRPSGLLVVCLANSFNLR